MHTELNNYLCFEWARSQEGASGWHLGEAAVAVEPAAELARPAAHFARHHHGPGWFVRMHHRGMRTYNARNFGRTGGCTDQRRSRTRGGSVATAALLYLFLSSKEPSRSFPDHSPMLESGRFSMGRLPSTPAGGGHRENK
jgi:hypothetical protein